MKRRRSTGALIGLAGAIGFLVATRAVVALDLPDPVSLLLVADSPVETLGMEWTETALWPADLQQAALRSLLATLGVLGLASLLVALLNVIILLVEAGASRRRELAVRVALGATPASLVRRLLAELRTLVFTGFSLGLLGGLAAGGLARSLWPDVTRPVTEVPFTDLMIGTALVLTLVAFAHVGGAWRLARGAHGMEPLRSGTRTTEDAAAIFGRSALGATHTAIAGTVMLSALVLLPGVTAETQPAFTSDDVYVVEARLRDGQSWDSILGALSAVPGLEAESLAAPGALLGLGVRDVTVSQCGACSLGGLPAPLWVSLADHQAVGPGFFDMSDVDLVDGRSFQPTDRAGAPLVAIVNEYLAHTAFEAGEPIGKQIQVGGDVQTWYTVVGVVADRQGQALGLDGLTRPTVYLSALQRSPSRARVLLRGDADAARSGYAIVVNAALEVEAPVTLQAYMASSQRARTWSARVALAASLLVLLFAAHGIYVVALQTTRRRARALAVRRAVGAASWRIVVLVIRERLVVAAWGLAGFTFFGTLALAFIRTALGLPAPGWGRWALLVSGLVAVALTASVRAALEAITIEPARLLE